MSKALRKKLILMLADPSISDDEFDSVAHWLETRGIAEVLRAAWDVRKTLHQYERLERSRHERAESLPSPHTLGEDKVFDEVERLLLFESGFSVKEALERLSKAADAQEEFDPRTSFRRGVERLCNKVGGSYLLSVAHQIRNNAIHGQHSLDWPLLGKSDVGNKKSSK